MTTVIMRSIIWVPIIMSVLAALSNAQTQCDDDADCMSNQFCYASSHWCVNYTVCSHYNRAERRTPAREPRLCGACFKGYFLSSPTRESTGPADSCGKDLNAQISENDTPIINLDWVIGFCIIAIIVFGFFCVILWAMCYRKFPCQNRAEPEKPAGGLLMVENGLCASAPPAPSPTQSRNNNKYDDAEESNPLSTTRDYRGNFMVDISRPVKAQPYHPPDWVSGNSNYNPGEEIQTVQTTFSPPDMQDEETIPSGWTPGPSSGSIVPSQPFAAIAEEVQDNTTNTALQRLACPSPSTSQEGHGDRDNNTSTGNSGGFNYNNTNGNGRGNSTPFPLVQLNQTVNFINHGSNGR